MYLYKIAENDMNARLEELKKRMRVMKERHNNEMFGRISDAREDYKARFEKIKNSLRQRYSNGHYKAQLERMKNDLMSNYNRFPGHVATPSRPQSKLSILKNKILNLFR